MGEPRASSPPPGIGPQCSVSPACYAALDLGTNNCRLLIATPASEGFRVIESFSRIVRLGDGLARSGRLDDRAMDRAMAALRICAEKIERRAALRVRAVATQACRVASNGSDFIARVAQETGISFSVISPREEARLSVAGCLNLLDRTADVALVIDVGGGSTELSWVDLRRGSDAKAPEASIGAWLSIPLGVVTLAERFPEPSVPSQFWYRAMVDCVRSALVGFAPAEAFRSVFDAERAHLIGTSGAITSLAGMHLGLKRYERSRVDGLWLSDADCREAARRLMALSPSARAAQPCIGPDRADLVLAGAAILEAVQEAWPCPRVRVADRGLREGILLSLMADEGLGGAPRRERRGGRNPAFSPIASEGQDA